MLAQGLQRSKRSVAISEPHNIPYSSIDSLAKCEQEGEKLHTSPCDGDTSVWYSLKVVLETILTGFV